jgi:AraC family transcriptional regulator
LEQSFTDWKKRACYAASMIAPLVASTQGHDIFIAAAGGFEFRVTEYSGGVALPAHRHERAKMSTSLRGGYTESYANKAFECDGRSLLVKPPDISHKDSYAAPSTICLTIDVTQPALEMVRAESQLFDGAKTAPLMTPLISRIMEELRTADGISKFALEGLALEIVAQAARRNTPPSRDIRAFRIACEFLEANMSSAPDVSSVASVAGVHPTHLRKLFRAHAGCSPVQWLRARRIEEAKKRLASAATIADVALALGFYDQSHFTNAFRREVGSTPAEFRRASIPALEA